MRDISRINFTRNALKIVENCWIGNGNPKENKEWLNDLVIKLQKNPKDEMCFRKIHYVMHPFISHTILKIFNNVPGNTPDDIYQHALIILRFVAVEQFNPNKGMSFFSWAKKCINCRISSVLQLETLSNCRKVLNDAYSLDKLIEYDDSDITFGDIVDWHTYKSKVMLDRSVDYNRNKFYSDYKKLYPMLSPLQKIILDIYLCGYDYSTIAKLSTYAIKNSNIKFPIKKVTQKTVDNSMGWIRRKAKKINENK